MSQFATYCAEDDKLRLYVGRVPRDEYEKLRAQGWTSTPKQGENGGCNFSAVWSVEREDTALSYSPDGIEDEDMTPEDRAADRAERFAGYTEKRLGEAEGHADKYDSGPMLHGHQSAALAERRARQHDRMATRATNQWEKAEYWQRRTAGVIRHALHVSSPGVRMGRIKEIEAEIRGYEKQKERSAAERRCWVKVSGIEDKVQKDYSAKRLAGSMSGCENYKHPRPETVINGHISREGSSLWTLMTMVENGYGSDDITSDEACQMWLARHPEPQGEGRWLTHLRLRLAYEEQMIEAQGGRAAHVEMEPGGWIGTLQVQKVNKSPATGRVVSVGLIGKDDRHWMPTYGKEILMTLNVERLKKEVYRAPTDEERAAFASAKKEVKKARAAEPKGPQLINPTPEDAKRLQAVWNAQNAGRRSFGDDGSPVEILMTTQDVYSRNLTAGSAKTYDLTGGGKLQPTGYDAILFPVVAKVRGSQRRVIVLTDKPQKPFPAEVWDDPRPEMYAEVVERIEEVFAIAKTDWLDQSQPTEQELFKKAIMVGVAYKRSASQFGLTEHGQELAREAGLFNKGVLT